MARPAHPGQFMRMEVIKPLDLSVTQAAKVLGVTRSVLSALLNGRAALSPDMALRIEKVCPPYFFANFGSVAVKVLPWLRRLVTVMSPSWARAMALARLRPRPMPGSDRL